MATAYHNLSDYDFNSVPSAENMKFGIVVSEWNYNITGALLKGAIDTLKKHGAKDENIMVKTVPGSFELTFGANQLIEYSEVDAVIAIGCVVRGETPHFGFTFAWVQLKGIHSIKCKWRCSSNLRINYPPIQWSKRRIAQAASWVIKVMNVQLLQ